MVADLKTISSFIIKRTTFAGQFAFYLKLGSNGFFNTTYEPNTNTVHKLISGDSVESYNISESDVPSFINEIKAWANDNGVSFSNLILGGDIDLSSMDTFKFINKIVQDFGDTIRVFFATTGTTRASQALIDLIKDNDYCISYALYLTPASLKQILFYEYAHDIYYPVTSSNQCTSLNMINVKDSYGLKSKIITLLPEDSVYSEATNLVKIHNFLKLGEILQNDAVMPLSY
jgi:hypothetical protein